MNDKRKTPTDDDKPAAQIARLFAMLDERAPALASLLPPDIPVKRFVGVVKTAIMQNPKLAVADRRSLMVACQRAAADRLLPDGKSAVLNVYRTNVARKGESAVWVDMVEYLPMSAGLIAKLYASGQVRSVDAAAVYERDEFAYTRGDDPKIVHVPYMGEDDPGPIVAAYAIIRLTNGETKREVMSRRDIAKVRSSSKAPDGPGWSKWEDQFAVKSVVKRAYKQLPSMPEFEATMIADNTAPGSGFATLSDQVGIATDTTVAPIRRGASAQLDNFSGGAPVPGEQTVETAAGEPVQADADGIEQFRREMAQDGGGK